MELTFRWSVFTLNDMSLLMLATSVFSFRRFFPYANFVITTNENVAIPGAEIVKPSGFFSCVPEIASNISNFKKWNPFRVSDGAEIYLDYDVFCLSHPYIIENFCADETKSLMIQTRTIGDLTNRHGFGIYRNDIDARVPPCCSGFVGSKPSLDFHEDRLIPHYWRAVRERGHWFCEQGSLVLELQDTILEGKALLADETMIRYGHPKYYPIDLRNPGCPIVHLISSTITKYQYFQKLRRIMDRLR